MKILRSQCKTLVIVILFLYIVFISLLNHKPNSQAYNLIFTPFIKASHEFSQPISTNNHDTITKSRTNLSHLLFSIVGSEKAWHYRKPYIESWWRPNITKGFLHLDRKPSDNLLPWPSSSPPYRISDDLSNVFHKALVKKKRIIHSIMEVLREVKDHTNIRWLVMGDDDSILFLENIVDVLATYDHTKYYYIGGQSEFIMSNYWYSFGQAFGGAGLIFSYPLAKAMADGMEKCLQRYRRVNSADKTTTFCTGDIGVSVTHLKGMHQMDLRGDVSGFLSSHPNFPLMSLHHFDLVNPIFPKMTRPESTRHLMTAAKVDQSRMLQQTICYHKQNNWSFSIAWGYSAHIYENVIPRSVLRYPIETFRTWQPNTTKPPHYMFNTRLPSSDPCEAPHVFYFQSIEKTANMGDQIVTSYDRARPRGMATCSSTGSQSADYIEKIIVFSPTTKRVKIDRSECCDIFQVDGNTEVKYRECMSNEVIA